MTDGIFRDDAERDAVVLRLEEQLKAIREDVIELKSDIKEFITCVEEIRREQSQLKTWTGIFSAVFIPIVVYLFQRALK
jgi:hypothetical protein